MNLNDYLREMRPAIETALQSFVDRSLQGEYPELRSMLTYHMGWEGEGAGAEAQGKRIRPLLVLLCAQAAGGDWRDALPAAVSVELLHNFSLIHDDIQDNSPLRRNRPTVWVKWGAAQAINAGDVLFTLSFLAVQDLAGALPPQSVLEVSRMVQQTCLRLTEGQYLDISYESKPDLPMDAYWPMIGGKTSALLACCTELGALVAGANGDCRGAFREYGHSLGLAFQVLDDWLGIWGDVALTGKSAESDLVSGKKTLPVVYGLSKDGPFARRWMQGKITPEEASALARMLEEEDASVYTLETAGRLTSQAISALQAAISHSRTGCAGDASNALDELTDMLLKRKN
jgi:geranylgeranyl diphosphate synthase, type I